MEARAVHARDGLKELVLADAAIEVQHLFDGGVKADKQHAFDTQKSEAILPGRVRIFEASVHSR